MDHDIKDDVKVIRVSNEAHENIKEIAKIERRNIRQTVEVMAEEKLKTLKEDKSAQEGLHH